MHVRNVPKIAKLSVPEKILLAEELWDSIAGDETTVSVPEGHRNELDKRLNAHRAAPGKLLTLQELQARIDNRK